MLLDMRLNNKSNPTDLYYEIESLYLKERFHSIIKFEYVVREFDSVNFSPEETKCLHEIFARTYLELDFLDKAKQIINQRLQFLNGKDMSDSENTDDLLIFTLLKLEVLQKQNLFKEEYQSILTYEKQGESDNQILNRKIEIEEALFMRYVKVNKYILYLILLSVLLVNLDMIPSKNDYLSILTGVAVVWYFLNIVMNCRVKRLYLNLMRLIYS